MTLISFLTTLLALITGYLVSVMAAKKTSHYTAAAYMFCFAVIITFVQSKVSSDKTIQAMSDQIEGVYISTPYSDTSKHSEIVEYAIFEIRKNNKNDLEVEGLSFDLNGNFVGKFISTQAKFNPVSKTLEYNFVGIEDSQSFNDSEGVGFYNFIKPSKFGSNKGIGEFKNPIGNKQRYTEFCRITADDALANYDRAKEIIARNLNLEWRDTSIKTQSKIQSQHRMQNLSVSPRGIIKNNSPPSSSDAQRIADNLLDIPPIEKPVVLSLRKDTSEQWDDHSTKDSPAFRTKK